MYKRVRESCSNAYNRANQKHHIAFGLRHVLLFASVRTLHGPILTLSKRFIMIPFLYSLEVNHKRLLYCSWISVRHMAKHLNDPRGHVTKTTLPPDCNAFYQPMDMRIISV